MAHDTGRNGRAPALLAALALAVAAAPATAFDGERPVILAQDGGGFLPGIFGGNRDRQQTEADRELRIQQLEAQVRTLMGEVERLSFELRNLSARLEALEGGRPSAPDRRGAAPAAAPDRHEAAAPPAPERDGPLDLSALNLGGAAGIGGLPAPGASERATDSFEAARRLFDAGRFGEAEQALRGFMTAFPADPRAGEAAFMIGEILLARGENREAANVFLASYTDFPTGRRASESLLKLGIALAGMGEREAACSSFRELLGAYPDAPADVRARAEAELASARCG